MADSKEGPSDAKLAKLEKNKARAEKKAAKTAIINAAKAGRVAKHKQDRKLQDKAANAASHPNKLAKRKARLIAHAENLEAQAKSLLAQAEEARRRSTQITPGTEKDDSDDSDAESDDGGAKVQSTPAEATIAEETVPAEIDDVVMEDAPVEKTKKNNKKDKKKKKEKKTLKPAIETPQESEDEAEHPDTHEQPACKDKAGKKRKLDARVDSEAVAPSPVTENASSEKKDKKKAKKEKKLKSEAPSHSEEKKPAGIAPENWNVQSLDGGSDRQSKFLRLLGGKKAGQAVGGADKARDHLDMKNVADNLEKQFEAGRHMKYETGGQKRGLGA